MQADAKEQIDRLLKRFGFVLERDTNHLVYRQVASGKTFTMAKTPSDFRAYPNALRDLKRIIGFKREFKAGERREKKRKQAKPEQNFTFSAIEHRVSKGTLGEQLLAVRDKLTLVSPTGRLKQSEPELQPVFPEPPRTSFQEWLKMMLTTDRFRHHEQNGFSLTEVCELVKLYEERGA